MHLWILLLLVNMGVSSADFLLYTGSNGYYDTWLIQVHWQGRGSVGAVGRPLIHICCKIWS